jgi:hypothetical protein
VRNFTEFSYRTSNTRITGRIGAIVGCISVNIVSEIEVGPIPRSTLCGGRGNKGWPGYTLTVKDIKLSGDEPWGGRGVGRYREANKEEEGDQNTLHECKTADS